MNLQYITALHRFIGNQGRFPSRISMTQQTERSLQK